MHKQPHFLGLGEAPTFQLSSGSRIGHRRRTAADTKPFYNPGHEAPSQRRGSGDAQVLPWPRVTPKGRCFRQVQHEKATMPRNPASVQYRRREEDNADPAFPLNTSSGGNTWASCKSERACTRLGAAQRSTSYRAALLCRQYRGRGGSEEICANERGVVGLERRLPCSAQSESAADPVSCGTAFSEGLRAEHAMKLTDTLMPGPRFLRRAAESAFKRTPAFEGLRILDVGCGGGIFSEVATVRHTPCSTGGCAPMDAEFCSAHCFAWRPAAGAVAPAGHSLR